MFNTMFNTYETLITTITLDKHHKLFLKRLSIAMSMEWIGGV